MEPSAVSGPSHTTEQFAAFFNEKNEAIRAASADAPPPTIRPRGIFNPTSTDEIWHVDRVRAKLTMRLQPSAQLDHQKVPPHHGISLFASGQCLLSQGSFPQDHNSVLVRPFTRSHSGPT